MNNSRNSRKSDAGFSLIELLVVVAILLVVAAIAVPNLLAAERSAKQSAAASSVRSIVTAERMYKNSFDSFEALAKLGGSAPCTSSIATGCFIDDNLATNGGGNGVHSYNYAGQGINNGTGTNNTDFLITATPVSADEANVSYCATGDGTIRKLAGVTTAADAPTCRTWQPI
jgi:type IV pilus assembly protein PilA